MSVSSRKRKLKHPSTVTNWRTKVDKEGLRHLDEYRRSKQEVAAEQRKTGPVNLVDEIIKVTKATSKPAEQSPEWVKFKSENPSIDKAVQDAVREAISSAEDLSVAEIWNLIGVGLEEIGPQGRRGVTFALAIAIHLLLSTFRSVRRKQFGNANLEGRELLWVFGTALETIGRVVRTGDPSPKTKGRVNAELLELLGIIRKHEKARLTYRELMDALEYAEVHVSSEEDLRLFVHRARKKGWLKK